jgi:hypothetical protein
VINCKVKNTTIDITMLETAVWQPDMKFTADRENEPSSKKKKNNYIIRASSSETFAWAPREFLIVI